MVGKMSIGREKAWEDGLNVLESNNAHCCYNRFMHRDMREKKSDKKHSFHIHLFFGMSFAVIGFFLLFVGAVSATDYYVSTTGDDEAAGSLEAPWATPTYAATQAIAGDTIYLFDGTWYEEYIIFSNSGNATHHIAMTAYNGTPILEGNNTYIAPNYGKCIYQTSGDYIDISDLTFSNYNKAAAQIEGINHWTFTNITSDPTGQYFVYLNGNCSYVTIDSCTINDCIWSSIQLDGQITAAIDHVYITNNVFFNNTIHGFVDLAGGWGLNYIEITGNNFTKCGTDAVFGRVQETGAWAGKISRYWNISDNVFLDITYRAIALKAVDSILNSNNFSDIGTYNMLLSDCSNVTINDNIFDGTIEQSIGGRGSTETINFDNNTATEYYASVGVITIEDPVSATNIFYEKLRYNSSTVETKFTSNTVFDWAWYTGTGGYTTIPVCFYSDCSNTTIMPSSDTDFTLKFTTYNMTAIPTSDSVTVTVNKFDTSLAQGETLVDFTADTVDGNNVVFTTWGFKPGYFYIINRDGIDFSTEPANSSGYIQFSNSEWSEQRRFTIEESSTPPAPTPEPELPGLGNISGTVTNRTSGAPIEGAKVEAGAWYDNTNENGEYSISNVPEGAYTVNASAEGYVGLSQSASVTESQTETVNFQLNPLGTNGSTNEYLFIEAEDADILTADFEIANDASASSSNYIWVPDGTGWDPRKGEATYNIHINSSGDYVIWGRVIAANGSCNSFFAQIDDGFEALWAINLSANWQWDAVNHWGNGTEINPEIDPVNVTLSAGDHTLKIKQREDGTKLDKLLITNNLSYVPTDAGGTIPPPATTYAITPTPTEAGWNNVSSVVMTFFRSDEFGIAYTNYSKISASGPWTTVTTSTATGLDAENVTDISEDTFNLTIADEGATTIWYYSVNNNATSEAVKDVTVKIDTTTNFGVEDTSGYKDTCVEVPVNITNVQSGPVISIIFDIAYDNSVINVLDIQKGTLTSLWDSPTMNTFAWGTRVTLVYDGQLADALQNGSTGSVALLNVSVIGESGESSMMNLTDIQLADPAYNVGTAPAKNGTFTVLAYGSVTGYVTNTTGGGIEGVSVNLTMMTNPSVQKMTITNETGYYSFTTVDTGEYALNCSKLRYWQNTTVITIEPDETETHDIILWKKGDLNDNNMVDAGDLAMMKDASVGTITADEKYDLNRNGIFADASDQAMMKDAFMGTIELL